MSSTTIIAAVILAVLALGFVLAFRRPSEPQGPSRLAGYHPSTDVLDHVRAGHTIRAIKAVREETGAGLREAKDFVDLLRPRG